MEDGRDKDILQDPVGGYSLEKAMLEWNSMKSFKDFGVKSQIPVALLKLSDIHGPKGEDLAFLIRTGESNIRLGYFDNNPKRIRSALGRSYDSVKRGVLSDVGRSLRVMHKNMNLCHNALHEENITLNGELVDFEYSSKSSDDLIYRDLWYCSLSFAEVFGTPLDLEQFVKQYSGKSKKVLMKSLEMKGMEAESKNIAEGLVQI